MVPIPGSNMIANMYVIIPCTVDRFSAVELSAVESVRACQNSRLVTVRRSQSSYLELRDSLVLTNLGKPLSQFCQHSDQLLCTTSAQVLSDFESPIGTLY